MKSFFLIPFFAGIFSCANARHTANISLPTDFFRSVSSGSWNNTATWESSSNNIIWNPATLTPGILASHVYIRSQDSVYLAGNITTQNLTVTDGIVNALGYTLTVTLQFNLLGNASFYQGGTVVAVPGTIQVLDPTSNYHFNGTQTPEALTLPAFGNLIWEPTPSSSGTFQNLTVPFPFNSGLLVLGDMTINLGAPFEVRFNTGAAVPRTHTINGNLNIIGANTTVVVQEGINPATSALVIGGDLNITGGVFSGLSPSGASGSSVVTIAGNVNNSGGTIQTGSGTGSYYFNFVGAGNVSVDAGNGNSFHNISVAPGKTLTLTNNNLNITSGKELVLDGNIILGNNDLNIDGTISNASLSSHIITNGTGLLTMKKVLHSASATFPVGATADTYDPVTITNNDAASIDFSAKVDTGITQVNLMTEKTINRTWTIRPAANPSSVNLSFQYRAGEGNAGFNYSSNLELGQYVSPTWNVIKTGIVPSGSYLASAANINSLGAGISSRLILGNLGAILGPVAVDVIYFRGTRTNNTHRLNWKIACNNTAFLSVSLERSASLSGSFVVLNTERVTATRCYQPFDYTDVQPLNGMNFYRLRMKDADGHLFFSNIIALLNAQKGFALLDIAPNPVKGSSFKLNATAAQNAKVEIVILNIDGKVINKQTRQLLAGSNAVDINVSSLPPATYNLYGVAGSERSSLIRFVKQ